MDLGSVLLAGLVATAGSLAVLALLRGHHRDGLMRLAAKATRDPETARAAGLVMHGASGAVWALAFAALWEMTGWPIAPLQGMLFALAPWALRLLAGPAAARSWPDTLASLASQATYGALLGLAYRPGA